MTTKAAINRLATGVPGLNAVLTPVRADGAAAEDRLGRQHATQLLEANEQLVLSGLRAQTAADTAAEAAAQALKQASQWAELDALTELPNRMLLRDRLAQAISGAKRRNARSALLFLDLNDFKQINDRLGHAFGDQVLKLAAGCLAATVRAADTVSRHGGDEFVILLAEVSQASDAVAIAEKLATALAVPSRVGDRDVRLTASIGISLYPDDGEDADTLIERADAAMYHAKRHGLRSFVFQHDAAVSEPGGPGADLPSLERQTVDMAELIDHAVQTCRPAFHERLQHIEVCLPSCALQVDGDPVRLMQVLCNLLDNASKYAQVGGEIGLSVTVAEGVLAMVVSDNGIGFVVTLPLTGR